MRPITGLLKGWAVSMALALPAGAASGAAVAEPGPKEPAVSWRESMEAGRAEAIKADRPVVLVFPAVDLMRHEWFDADYARKEVNAAKVVAVRVLPPLAVNLPAGATDQQRQALAEAQKKLEETYRALCLKYGVTALPTVLYLSPDGETIFRSYPRTMETTVVDYLHCLESDFANYRKTREVLKARLKEKGLEPDKARFPEAGAAPTFEVSLPDGGPTVKWFCKLRAGIEDATAADRPIVLVCAAGDAARHEWFHELLARKALAAANLTAVCILPPADFAMPLAADEKQRQVAVELKKDQFASYQKVLLKYGVSTLPTVLFLSPDGETVLRRYPRTMETTVVEYFKSLPADFANYKKIREVLKTAGKDPGKGTGAADNKGGTGTPASATAVDNF